MVSSRLNNLFDDILKDYGCIQSIKEGYIPVQLAIKVDSLTEYVTDHVDEIMLMNKLRQPAILDSKCGIEIREADGVNNKGEIIKYYAFCDSIAPTDKEAMICDEDGHLIKFEDKDAARKYLDEHISELEDLSVGQFYERKEMREI